MKKDGEKKSYLKIYIISLIIILFLALIWIIFFYSRTCENRTCFNDYLIDCKRANFMNQGNMTFAYKILGRKGDSCLVNVRMIKGDLNNKDSLKLEDKDMECSIPLGVVILPESNIDNCHGLLKEGLQDLIITKLHTYIVQNIGKINSDILS